MIEQRTEMRVTLLFLCGNLKSVLPNVVNSKASSSYLTAERLASIIRSSANIEVTASGGVLSFGEGVNTYQITMEEIYLNPPKLDEYSEEEAAYMQTIIHLADVTHQLRQWFPKLSKYIAVNMGETIRQLIDVAIRDTAMGYRVEVPMDFGYLDRWEGLMKDIEYIKQPASGGSVTIKLKTFNEVTFHKDILDILDFRV